MRKISKLFIQGLVVLLPTIVTIYALYWVGASLEHSLGRGIRSLLPDKFYIPGMGIIAGFIVIFFIGVLMNIYLVQRLYKWYEKFLERVPFIKSLYGALSDLTSFFSGEKGKPLNKVVMVKIGGTNINLLGLVTREDFDNIPNGIGDEDTIAVYLPMSYQIGGFTVMVPRSSVTNIDMSVESALSFSLTAGVVSSRAEANKKIRKK